jgi:serpin B
LSITALGLAAQEAAPVPDAGASAPGVAPTAAAASAAPAKDIVLDAPAQSLPSAEPVVAAAPPPAAAEILPAQAHTAAAASLADLGLALLRDGGTRSGGASVNQVVSPLSVAASLGLVHAGSAGTTAAEIAALMNGSTGGDAFFRRHFPATLAALSAGPQAGRAQALRMGHRVWLDRSVVAQVPGSYAALATARLGADAAVLDFRQSEPARRSINAWIDERTAGRIPELLGRSSITPTTRFVATSALHFRSPWAVPFDRAATTPQPFVTASGAVRNVPTMRGERAVQLAQVGAVQVIEVPFENDAYVLRMALVPKGHTLQALQAEMTGADLVALGSRLRPARCQLSLPRFAVRGAARDLKPALEALGMQAAFSGQADFTPLAGAAGKALQLSEVVHGATFEIDEAGGEATAATAAVGQVKSFSAPAAACPVDRPFLFAVLHRESQTPVVVGTLGDPGAR